MTGTGTKTDPYIIRTWSDLLETVIENDVYIELGSDIDCKGLGPITIPNSSGRGSYPLNCALLDAKGHSIKNLFLLDSTNVFSGVRANTIKDLTFTNIYLSNSSLFLFDEGYYLPTFTNCHFNAMCVDGSEFIDSRTIIYAAVFRKSSFHILCKNSEFTRTRPTSQNRCPILLDDCTVELYGDYQQSAFAAQLINSQVTGEVTINDISVSYPEPIIQVVNSGCNSYYTSEFLKSNSIVNLIVHNNTGSETLEIYVDGNSYTDDVGDGTYKDVTETLFINTEVIDDVTIRQSKTFQSCTSLQINNKNFLTSHGFSVEETWEDQYVRKESLNTVKYTTEDASYIDTGVTNDSNVKIMSEFEFTFAGTERGFAIGAYGSNGYGVAHGTGNGINIDNLETIQVNIRPDYYYGITGTKFHCYTPGTTWWGTQSEFPMIINGQNYGGTKRYGMDGKIYHVSIWDSNNTLIRDYYPVYDKVNQVYGMYDKVNHVFYGSDTDIPFSNGDSLPFRFVGENLVHHMENNILRSGAFYNAVNLTEVQIPETVKSIGRFSFANTKLKKVKIASDCEFYDTSFPRDCEIEYYE